MKTAEQLERAVVAFVKELRGQLSECDSLNGFRLDVEAGGRIRDGEVNVTFVLNSENAYSTEGKASGGRLLPVVSEFMRRNDWNARNAPLCIGVIESNASE